MKRYFRYAKQVALKGSNKRRYCLGAIGIRTDGVIVRSNNLPCKSPEPNAHAESRVTKKLNYGSVIYVVRVLKNGDYANARPCKNCVRIMKLRGVKRCYYTITNNEYGVLIL